MTEHLVAIATLIGSALSVITTVTAVVLWLRRSAAAEARSDERFAHGLQRIDARINQVTAAGEETRALVCEARDWLHELREWRAAEAEAAKLTRHRLDRLEAEDRRRTIDQDASRGRRTG